MTEATKVRPISFSGPMVRALLGRRKTQTRRVIKGAPESHVASVKTGEDFNGRFGVWFFCRGPQSLPASEHNYSKFIACPYGRPGDRLWVKEAFRYSVEHDNYYYCADQQGMGMEAYVRLSGKPSSAFRAIFMPRWASRITLEITGVRVERLQDITPADITAEGFPPDDSPTHDGARLTAHGRRLVFAETWDELNADRGFSFDSNPWVRVLSLRQVDDLSELRAAGLSAWDDIEDPEAYLRGDAK